MARSTLRRLVRLQAPENALTPSILVTGCIRVAQISQLDADGYGGQYDSNGSGNPEGSKCKGYVVNCCVISRKINGYSLLLQIQTLHRAHRAVRRTRVCAVL
jgi:hypothetical protein